MIPRLQLGGFELCPIVRLFCWGLDHQVLGRIASSPIPQRELSASSLIWTRGRYEANR